MPLNTHCSPSSVPPKRIAQEATERSGALAFNAFSTASGTIASPPPFTGSIMMTGLPCLRMTS